MDRPLDIQGAKRVQQALEKKVRLKPLTNEPATVAGVDAAFIDDRVIAAVCVYTYPELSLIETSHAIRKNSFPYIPGFLSFREGPAIIDVIRGLKVRPDLIIFDGQGIAHPRGLGLASHMGVLLGIPSVGCAKSRLVGEYREPGRKKGQGSPLTYRGRTVGAVMRTRDNVRPLFVSPGHRIDIAGGVRIVAGCLGKYRLPEPLRCADLHAAKIKRGSTAAFLS